MTARDEDTRTVTAAVADFAGRFGGRVDPADRWRVTFPSVPDAVRFAALMDRPEWAVELAEPAASLHGPCAVRVTVPGVTD